MAEWIVAITDYEDSREHIYGVVAGTYVGAIREAWDRHVDDSGYERGDEYAQDMEKDFYIAWVCEGIFRTTGPDMALSVGKTTKSRRVSNALKLKIPD